MTTKRFQNPKGGLNKAGRIHYKVKKGVIKPKTKEDYRRRYSWASRFMGRKKLPPLVKNGKPTRFALTAHAWGYPVPKNKKQARSIYRSAKKDYYNHQ